MKELFSVIIPVRNASATIPLLVDEIELFFSTEKQLYEIILVNDSSGDDSWEKIKNCCKKNPAIKGFCLDRNYGQFACSGFGIEQAKGDFIITIDDDLQYPVAEIKKLVTLMKDKKLLLVFGIPARKMHSRIRVFLSKVVFTFFRLLILPEFFFKRYSSSFKVIDRKLIENTKKSRGTFNVYYIWEFSPHSIGSVTVNHNPRFSGISNYNFFRLLSAYYPYLLFMLYRISTYSFFFTLILGAIKKKFSFHFNYSFLLPACIISLFCLMLSWFLLRTYKRKVCNIAEKI